MGHEVETNMKTLASATSANANEDYYNYDEELADYYDDLEDKKLRKSLLAKYDYDFSNYYDDDDDDAYDENLMDQKRWMGISQKCNVGGEKYSDKPSRYCKKSG